MTGSGEYDPWPGAIVSVRLAEDDTAQCRRCGQPIGQGRRVAFVAGLGNSHLACLIRQPPDSERTQAA